MADRIEREIEEILAKLDQEQPPPRSSERAPISILAHRDKAKAQSQRKFSGPRGSLLDRVSPATLLLTGAVLVVGGLIFSNAWAPLIWASFVGVVLFLGAFAWSFVRTPRAGKTASAGQGHYWRDRYIEYTPPSQSAWGRLRRRFRR